MKKILVAGPDSGMEFGWALMRWQAKLRYLSKGFEVYVISTPDRMFMYEDFAKPYTEMINKYSRNMWRFNGPDVAYLQPNKEFCCSEGNEKFVKFPSKTTIENCIAIHMRKKEDGREWNWSKWCEFIMRLGKNTNLPIYSIGSMTQTHQGLEAKWYYGADVLILNSAVLCIGPSSGPMHLASLCGTPHLVWTDKKRWNLGFVKGTNRDRYERHWNPFNTKAIVVDEYGWNPPVGVILDETVNYLKRSGVK
jgi:hypothetical protein